MKTKLFVMYFLFVLVSSVSSQQCNSGGCTNFVNEYPKGPFSTTSSTWSLVNGGNNMNAGNWTLFNVTSGNTYEWSYCEDFGGVSTSWDAQLTLFNNTNITTPICFSTDDCGTNGLAPYLSWKATFTGIVRVLTTAFVNNTKCQTNSGSPYNKLVWRQSASATTGYNLTITVNNVDGTTKISGATVKLYNLDYTDVLDTKTSNSSGQVVFTGLANNSYNYEVYYTPTGKNPPISNEEFWGAKTINISGSAKTDPFTRTQPYITSFPPFSSTSFALGQQTTGNFAVKNPLGYSQNTFVKVWVDRSQTSLYDNNGTSSAKLMTSGSPNTFTVPFTPTNAGTYYAYVFVYTTLSNGKDVLTDQYTWKEAFTVTATLANSILTVKPSKLNYSSLENVVFSGSILTSTGQPVPNVSIGVDDPLQQQCLVGPFTTDSNGKFSWTSTNKSDFTGICAYTFHGPTEDIYCILSINPIGGLSLTSKSRTIKLGITNNIADVNLALTKKAGNILDATNGTLLNEIGTLLNDVGETIIDGFEDFTSNKVNVAAGISAIACLSGSVDGVGLAACPVVIGFVAKEFSASVIETRINHLIDQSDLTQEQKLYSKEIAPSVDCVKGLVELSTGKGLVNPLEIASTAWNCNSAISNISKIGNKRLLTIRALPSSTSTSQDVVGVYIITQDAPANDNCADAILLTDNNTCSYTSGTVDAATDDGFPNLPSCNGTSSTQYGVFYKFIATSTSTKVTVDPDNTSSTGLDAVVVVYSGTSCNNLSEIGCLDPSGKVKVELTLNGLKIGQTYWIRVYDFGSAQPPIGNGGFRICVSHTPTSINEVSTDDNIKIYPNPTTGKFDISMIETLGSYLKIDIIDFEGKTVNSSFYENIDNKISLDLSSLPNGLYIIKLSNDNVTYQKKVLKN